jgi:hypothetical protein
MRAIAMRATQEDWDSVKDLVKGESMLSFENAHYLVTNFFGKLGRVTNVNAKNAYDRQVYETFDRSIFLDALDIVEEKIWKGTEMQVRINPYTEWIDAGCKLEYRLKPINPEIKQLKELADKLGYKIEKL